MAAFNAVARFSGDDRFSSVIARMGLNTERFSARSRASFSKVEQSALRLKKRIAGIGSELKMLVGFAGITGLLLVGANAIKEYDAATASLQAITGATAQEMVGYKAEIKAIGKDTKESTIAIAKGFELVGSAKPELLASSEALGAVTRSAITLSRASGMQLTESVDAVTTALNQFELPATQSQRIINALAAGSKEGAAAIPSLTATLQTAGTVAKAANVRFEEFVGLAETLAEKQIRGAEAGTALRNVLTKISAVKGLPKEAIVQLTKFGVNIDRVADSSIPFQERLREFSKIAKDNVALTKVFGTENLVAGQILLNNVDKVGKYAEKVTGTNIAAEQAAINSATLSQRIIDLKNSYTNAITAQSENSAGLKALGGVIGFVTDNMSTFINIISGVAAVVIPLIALWKTVTAVTWLFNAAAAISALIQGKGAIALKGSAGALKIYNAITKKAAAIQWLLNAAMSANPIGLIVVGIAAAIAAVTALVVHWNKIKEAWSNTPTWVKFVTIPLQLLAAPLLILINTIRNIVDAWGGIKKAFTDGGFVAGIKKIGGVLLSSLIDPLVYILKLAAKIPGLGGKVDPLIEKIEAFQARAEGGFGVDQQIAAGETEQTTDAPVNVAATESVVRTEQIQKGMLDININDPNNRATATSSNMPVGVAIAGTQDF